MIQDETITIEIVRQRDDQSMDALQTQALDLIKQLITQEFFTPAMSNAAAAATPAASQFSSYTAPSGGMNTGSAGSNGRVEVGFQLQFKHQEELDTLDVDFSVAAPETRTHAPNGFFSALLTDIDKATHIREIDLDDPFFRQIDVTVSTTGDFERYDIQSAVVDLQHGGTVDAPIVDGAISFTPANQTGGHFTAFPDAGDYGVRHRLTFDFGDSPDIAGQPDTKHLETEWTSDPDRTLVVHPSDDVSVHSVFVEPGVIDWDVVDRVETTLTYNDPANSFTTARTYIVAATSTREEWKVRLTDPTLTGYTVQHRWHLKDGKHVIDGKPTPCDLDHLYVPDPFVDRLVVTVSGLVDKASVARVDVELTYDDPDHDLSAHKILTVLGPDFAPAALEIPLMDSDQREYTYQATLVKVNGTPEQQKAVTTDSSSLFITEGGHYLDVNVMLLEPLAAAGLDGLQVDLRSDPPDDQEQQTQSIVFGPADPTRATVRLLLRSDRATDYEFQTTAYLTNGAPVVRPWAPNDVANLVLQPARLTSTG